MTLGRKRAYAKPEALKLGRILSGTPRADPVKIRRAILQGGHSISEINGRLAGAGLKLSESGIKNQLRRMRAQGIAVQPNPRAQKLHQVSELLKEAPQSTTAEIRESLAKRGIKVSNTSIMSAKRKLNLIGRILPQPQKGERRVQYPKLTHKQEALLRPAIKLLKGVAARISRQRNYRGIIREEFYDYCLAELPFWISKLKQPEKLSSYLNSCAGRALGRFMHSFMSQTTGLSEREIRAGLRLLRLMPEEFSSDDLQRAAEKAGIHVEDARQIVNAITSKRIQYERYMRDLEQKRGKGAQRQEGEDE